MANVSSLVSAYGGRETGLTVTQTTDTQAAAIAGFTLPGMTNTITTMAASSMGALPTLPAGSIVVVTSTVAINTLKIYPPVGGTIQAAGTAGTVNAAVTMAALGSAVFIATGSNGGTDFFRIV
jgi:hypothetical protein